jgi:hypothetical protein
VLADLEPDYGKTVEEVYTEVAITIIEKTPSLDVLAFAELSPITGRREAALACTEDCLSWAATPTWVARWDEATYFPTLVMCMLPLHIKTLAHNASAVLADVRKDILSVQGLLVDEVTWVAPVLQLPDKADAEPLLKNPKTILEI